MINDKVGVMPTDTIYGLCASAFSKQAVGRIYELKGRQTNKPMIVLISSPEDLKLFNIKQNQKQNEILSRLWPGKISIVLQCKNKKFDYLTRGTNTLAFRLPSKKSLLKILMKTGPLVSSSVNIEGKAPAKNIQEAKEYFGTRVDYYIDGGEMRSKPSTLISIVGDTFYLLRKGGSKIPKNSVKYFV